MPQENKLVPGDRIPGKNKMNGRVRTIFDDGNYSFYLFFIVESEYVDSIKEVFDSRQIVDLTDLHYINCHSKELNIDKNLVNFFMKNIPDFSVYKAYAIAYLMDGN